MISYLIYSLTVTAWGYAYFSPTIPYVLLALLLSSLFINVHFLSWRYGRYKQTFKDFITMVINPRELYAKRKVHAQLVDELSVRTAIPSRWIDKADTVNLRRKLQEIDCRQREHDMKDVPIELH